jgi:hypothetical protein
MEFQEGGGTLDLALLLAAALGLDFAEVIHGLLELAGEALVVQALGELGLGGENGAGGRQTMAQGVERGTLFAGIGARSGGSGGCSVVVGYWRLGMGDRGS